MTHNILQGGRAHAVRRNAKPNHNSVLFGVRLGRVLHLELLIEFAEDPTARERPVGTTDFGLAVGHANSRWYCGR